MTRPAPSAAPAQHPAQHPTSQRTNRLAGASSPYLLQHAHNPVEWWPWCPEALALARATDRPILLSIGYSACHWCHVMAHESFEDADTAAVMNRLFVNIKVDREERPDLDRVYQTAHQLLAQRPGGWPLTVFLSPTDLKPFFAGTYFPPEPRHGLPAFRDLLAGIAEAWQEQRPGIEAQNRSLMEALADLAPVAGDGVPDAAPLDGARRQLAGSFDGVHGGFGRAPKFPHPTHLQFLLRHYLATAAAGQPDRQALYMVSFTLERMIRGGMNDQLRGGFCRYSVDAQWMIPHFEKMLYDNGPLLGLCCDLWQVSGRAVFRDAAIATADWVLAEMTAPAGGWYSALDADSEGEEGRFYLWDRTEVQALLTPAEYALLAPVYGLDRPPNFEGRWHLHTFRPLEEVADELGIPPTDAPTLLSSARAKLLAARDRRVRPGCDDKLLTAWNALMLKGMAQAARVFGRADYLAAADRALACIRAHLWRDGRLLASWRGGEAHLNAYLDDHALLLDALLELLQTRWRRADLDLAVALAEALLARFADPEQGGFFFTSHDHEQLILRPKPLADEAIPAGNGVAAFALQRLGHLLGEPRYLAAATATLRLAMPSLRGLPYAHGSLLAALDEHLHPPEVIVIRAANADTLAHWQRQAQAACNPRRLVLAIPAAEGDLPGALAGLVPGNGPVAYRCRGTHCDAPVREVGEL